MTTQQHTTHGTPPEASKKKVATPIPDYLFNLTKNTKRQYMNKITTEESALIHAELILLKSEM